MAQADEPNGYLGFGVDADLALTMLRNKMGLTNTSAAGSDVVPQDLPFSDATKAMFQKAQIESRRVGMSFVTPEHLFMALVDSTSPYVRLVLNMFQVDDDVLKVEALRRLHKAVKEGQKKDAVASGGHGSGGVSGQGKEGDGEILEKFCRDLCQEAAQRKIDPIIGRMKEVHRVAQILARRTKNNPILLGEPGVGKTAIAEGLACSIVRGSLPDGSPLPEFLKNKRLLQVDVPLLIAGSKERGELELRVTGIIRACKEDRDIILVIDEIHTMVGGGSSSRGSGVAGSGDIGNLFKPALSRGEIVCIGASTLDEHKKYIQSDAALERRFQQVVVEQPTDDDTVTILKGVVHLFERHHRCVFTDEAIEDAVHLSSRYISDRQMPDKAIDVLDEAGSRVRIKAFNSRMRSNDRSMGEGSGFDGQRDHTGRGRSVPTDKEDLAAMYMELDQVLEAKEDASRDMLYEEAGLLRRRELDLRTQLQGHHDEGAVLPVVGPEDIAAVISSWTGIPMEGMSKDAPDACLQLEDKLSGRVIGQDDAIRVASRAVSRAVAGIGQKERPIATLLFSGPTGVGKTELCKALAQEYFAGGVETSADTSLIRLDMSEYMERHTVSKLIGAPPGYVGFSEGGKLTEAIRRNPHSLVLLDEIEKAHPDVFNILLQMIEEGRLTDSSGRTVNFNHSLIILTSNIGSSVLSKGSEGGIGFNIGGDDPEAKHEQLRSMVFDELKAHFRPELLNRLDDIVVFKKLDRESIAAITRNEVEKTIHLIREAGLDITVTESVYGLIAEQGFNDATGAREIRRAVAGILESPLSDAILKIQSSGMAVTHVVAHVSGDGKLEIVPWTNVDAIEVDELNNVKPIITAEIAEAAKTLHHYS
jgi:ATP-dependent Clp protease ATP-binding subunit ClpC